MSYPKFKPEMKNTHKILIPGMFPVHFRFLKPVISRYGYDVEVLENESGNVIEEGLRYVHNDTCYPALLVIGQFIDALKSGKYDVDHVVLVLTQTGGGCRASNYIYLLRKALVQAGFPQVPVVPVNLADLKNPQGFPFTNKMLADIAFSFVYGDLIMWLKNQCLPYEIQKGATQKVVDDLVERLCQMMKSPKFYSIKSVYKMILKEFKTIERVTIKKPKVGIVGEIYMKYAPLGNNHLEDFLIEEGCEPVLTGVIDFALYCLQHGTVDHEYYGMKSKKSANFTQKAIDFIVNVQEKANDIIKKDGTFEAPHSYREVYENHQGIIDKGVKMGEGWLLPAEIVTFVKHGVHNVVATQPFGCLPNHIVAKGMAHKIKSIYPEANIVAIDYDPSATKVNQENRLKLMLSSAKLKDKYF